MNDLAAKWDKKFSSQSCESVTAGDVLAQYRHLLPTGGVGLDYACGLGANAILLAKSNLETHAWDISRVALDKLDRYAARYGLKISTQVRNVEIQPPGSNTFDVIVVNNFLHRPTFTTLIDALRRNGLLFYQTFIANKASDVGPSNPDFLLASNELLRLCKDLEILAYREEGRQGNIELGFRNQAMVVAKKS